jgi:hypothetical protein
MVHDQHDSSDIDDRDRAEHDERRPRDAPEPLPICAERGADDLADSGPSKQLLGDDQCVALLSGSTAAAAEVRSRTAGVVLPRRAL